MTPEQECHPAQTSSDEGSARPAGCLTAEAAETEHRTNTQTDDRRRFLEIIHGANYPILLIDGGKFVDCNDAAAQMLGHFGNDFLLTHPGELSPETQPDGRSSLEKARQMMQIALDTGFHRFEWMHRKASGEDIPVEVSLTPVVHDGRTILHCVWRDITEEKRAKREQERTLNRLERLNQLQGRLILPGEESEKFSLITRAAVEILGLDFCRIWITRPADLCEAGCPHAEGEEKSAACRRHDGCLHLVAGSGRYTHLDGQRRRIPLGRCVVGELAAGSEKKVILRDLREHPGGFNREWIAEIGPRSFAGYRLCDTTGRILGVLGMFSKGPFSDEDDAFASNLAETTSKTVLDIEAHAELVEARSRAEAATKAKDCFLANMSHEIRTPMTAILGFTDILVRDLIDPDALQAAKTVKRNGEHLLAIINDVLDIARIEAGKIEIELMPWSTKQVFEECVELLKLRAEAKGLKLAYEQDGPLPDTITTDPTRLRQILINLIGNAIKFTQEGSIRVVARLVEEPGSPREVRCDVIDTGIGIPESFKDAVFDPFMQVDQSSTRNFEGTGLGLAISRRLAGMLGGDIRLKSPPGGGSIFTLTLPAGAEEQTRTTASAAPLNENPRASGEPREARRQLHGRVLLVEDVPVSQLLLKAILREVGVEVTLAQDGGEAVEKALATLPGTGHGGARFEPFDVILMDMQMPVLDGYEATRRLRSEGYSGPIVALTAHAMRGDRRKCLEAGCDDYLSKPIDREQLLETLKTWL